ncbi:hypothetical protein [Streptantibioticus ferralitis]|uniref:Heme exporter protein D n=1 Tax=Streptantibioticus ferralitis TaxID=236510 RepID=A0ABT5YVF5_9ACTN|nr:hypothetical protein [Streptantibioticus ferralitis]MDF2255589.1 hypothetical protein [Streptantibioticus ferralitis]
MSTYAQLLHDAYVLVGATGTLYAATVAIVAGVCVLARKPQRRRDARATLELLLRQQPRSR